MCELTRVGIFGFFPLIEKGVIVVTGEFLL